MKGLQLRPGGWYLRVRHPLGLGEIVRALGTHDRSEAERLAPLVLQEALGSTRAPGGQQAPAQTAIVAATPPSPGVPVAVAVDAFLRSRRSTWAPGTARGAARHLRLALDLLPLGATLDQVSRGDVFALREALRERGLAPSTVNLTVTWLGALFRWAVDEAGLTERASPVNASHRLEDRRKDSEQRPAFTRDELARVMGGWHGSALPWLVLYAGLRPGEAAMLTLDDVIALDGGRLGLRVKGPHVKTKAGERVVPVHPELEERLPMVPAGARLFPSGCTREPAAPVSRAFSAHLRRLGLHRHALYSLRHSFATALGANLTPDYVVSWLMGHRSASLAGNRYSKPDLGAMTRAVDALDFGL